MRSSTGSSWDTLSQAMLMTWRRREGDRLTRRGYVAAGGIENAVRTAAEEVYHALPPAQQELVPTLFQCLTQITPDGGHVRRAVRVNDAESRAVLERFVAEAFLTASAQKVRRKGLAWLAATVALVTIAGVTWMSTSNERALAEARSLSATVMNRSHAVRQSDPFMSGLLAAAAWQIWHSGEARQGMLDFLATTAQTVMPVSTAGGISPDGDVIVTIGTGDTIEVWDVKSRRRVGTLPDSHTGSIFGTLFSPDGKILASVGQDHTVRLWDVASRKPVNAPIMPVPDVSDPNGRVDTVGFSPDGEVIAVATLDERIRFYDVVTGKPAGSPMRRPPDTSQMAFGPDGRTIFTVQDESMRVWDRVTGQRLSDLPVKVDFLGLHGGILLTYHDGEVRLWQASSLRSMGDPIRTGKIEKFAVNPNGSTLATAVDRSVQYWDVKTGRRTGTTVTGHTDDIVAMSFTSDGARLWTTSHDGTGRLWNTTTLARIGDPITLSKAGTSSDRYAKVLSFGSDGSALTVAIDDVLQQWTTDGRRGQALPAGALAVSPDGRTVAVAQDGKLVLRDRATGRRVGASLRLPDGNMQQIAFSPSWRSVAIAERNDIQVWDLATGRPLSRVMTGHGEDLTGHDPDNTVITGPIDGIADMAFSPDGATLASAGVDGVLRFWNVATGRATKKTEEASADVVEIDRSGHHAVTLWLDPTDPDFGVIRLWDVATRRPIGAPIKGHQGFVTSLVFSPDGKVLASAGDDGTVRLWSTNLPDDPQKAVCAVAGRPLTEDEWRRHLPETAAPEHLGCGRG